MNSSDDEIKGFVSDIQGPTVFIEQVGFDGDTVISINDITDITCDSEKEHTIKLLYENR